MQMEGDMNVFLVGDASRWPDTVSVYTDLWGHENLTSVDEETGIYFADAEKTLTDNNDNLLCWLATASNVMQWAGWVQAGDITIKNEDQFFEHAKQFFHDEGGFESDAFFWWLNGTVTFEYSPQPLGGGAKLPDLNPDDYTVYSAYYMSGKSEIDGMLNYIDCGYGIGLGIYNTTISHAISCWGYEINNGVISLYYSDSDDGQITTSDRTESENVLHSSTLKYDLRKRMWYMADYDYPERVYIGGYTAIKQYDKIMTGQQETTADAREVVAEVGKDSTARRGALDGENDNDYYVFSGNGRGALFNVTFLQDSDLTLSVTMYDEDGTVAFEFKDIKGTSGGYTTLANEKYYLEISGNMQAKNVANNVYQINVVADKWFGEWAAASDSAPKIVDILIDAAEDGKTFVGDFNKYATASGDVAFALIGDDGFYKNIYGGSAEKDVAGNIYITGFESKVNQIWGGGAAGSTVNGAIYITLDGKSSVKQVVYGGGASTVNGNVNIELAEVSATANIYGGSYNATVKGEVNLTLKAGGVYSGLIFGGSRVDQTTVGQSNVNIAVDGNVLHQDNVKLLASGNSAWIVGGGQAVNGGVINGGNVAITIKNEAMLNRVVGGGQATGAGSATLMGDVAITVENATVTGNIYAGGYVADGGVSSVQNCNITINAIGNTVIQGNIYASGCTPYYQTNTGKASVLGDSTITFTGNSDYLTFNGKVFGDSFDGGAVSGAKTMIFNDYSGEFNGEILAFDALQITGNTNVVLNMAANVNDLAFVFDGAVKTTENALVKADELSFDTIKLNFAESLLYGDFEFELFSSANLDFNSLFTSMVMDDGTKIADLNFSETTSLRINAGTFNFEQQEDSVIVKYQATIYA